MHPFVRGFESYFLEHCPQGMPDSLYEPIRYMNALGGKRLRPLLVLLAYNLWHEDISPALPAANAVELFHNFTLMHDDIMDEAPLRRGNQSVHLKFGPHAAILSGDAMLIRSFEMLIELDYKYKLGCSLAGILSKAAVEICEGQQMDMDAEHHMDFSPSAYLEMIRKKTACLLGASLKIGACLAGGSSASEKLYAFGENLGMAFQIQDDMLDTFGEPDVTGKQAVGDILRGKKNFPYVYACAALGEAEKNKFAQLYLEASRTKDPGNVMDTYNTLNIQTQVNDVIQGYFQRAMECLNGVANDVSTLKRFAEEMMERKN